MMKKTYFHTILFLFIAVLTSVVTACSSDDEDGNSASGANTDSRFVGTWVRDESVTNVVEQVYTLVLNADGTASYSWYRNSKTTGNSGHQSSGRWSYDSEDNRIITDCTTSATGNTIILDVVSVSSTTLVVKQEGAKSSKTYVKK